MYHEWFYTDLGWEGWERERGLTFISQIFRACLILSFEHSFSGYLLTLFSWRKYLIFEENLICIMANQHIFKVANCLKTSKLFSCFTSYTQDLKCENNLSRTFSIYWKSFSHHSCTLWNLILMICIKQMLICSD